MKARKLIGDMTLGPEALKVIGHAFDEAWQEIEGNFGSDPQEIEAVRLKLAEAFLSVALGDLLDPQVLKRAALQRLALDFRKAGGSLPVIREPRFGGTLGSGE
jgi:hypothetical protein